MYDMYDNNILVYCTVYDTIQYCMNIRVQNKILQKQLGAIL